MVVGPRQFTRSKYASRSKGLPTLSPSQRPINRTLAQAESQSRAPLNEITRIKLIKSTPSIQTSPLGRKLPGNVGWDVSFTRVRAQNQTDSYREEFRTPSGVGKSPRNEPAVCRAGPMGI